MNFHTGGFLDAGKAAGEGAEPALAPQRCIQGCSVINPCKSSALRPQHRREKLGVNKRGATAVGHTASIRSVLTYFGFVAMWLLMGSKEGLCPCSAPSVSSCSGHPGH